MADKLRNLAGGRMSGHGALATLERPRAGIEGDEAPMQGKSTDPARSGPRNPFWKGGRTIASNGYVLIKRPDHPLADVRGYVYEHRLVAEEKIGRSLLPGEQVHHINHDKTDNRPENLEVTASRAHHAAHHRKTHFDLRLPGELNPMVQCACGCGGIFEKFDSSGRPRRFISGHNAGFRR